MSSFAAGPWDRSWLNHDLSDARPGTSVGSHHAGTPFRCRTRRSAALFLPLLRPDEVTQHPHPRAVCRRRRYKYNPRGFVASQLGWDLVSPQIASAPVTSTPSIVASSISGAEAGPVCSPWSSLALVGLDMTEGGRSPSPRLAPVRLCPRPAHDYQTSAPSP